jgi:hypothetical protein
VQIAYTLWQVLTGDISVLDSLKKIGLAVLGFLLTPFRWVIDIVQRAWGIIKGVFSWVVGFVKEVGSAAVEAFVDLPLVRTLMGISQDTGGQAAAGNLCQNAALM